MVKDGIFEEVEVDVPPSMNFGQKGVEVKTDITLELFALHTKPRRLHESLSRMGSECG